MAQGPARRLAIALDDVNAVAREKGQAIGRTYAKMLNIDPQFVGLDPGQLEGRRQRRAMSTTAHCLPRARYEGGSGPGRAISGRRLALRP